MASFQKAWEPREFRKSLDVPLAAIFFKISFEHVERRESGTHPGVRSTIAPLQALFSPRHGAPRMPPLNSYDNYGWYSNRSRGDRAKEAAASAVRGRLTRACQASPPVPPSPSSGSRIRVPRGGGKPGKSPGNPLLPLIFQSLYSTLPHESRKQSPISQSPISKCAAVPTSESAESEVVSADISQKKTPPSPLSFTYWVFSLSVAVSSYVMKVPPSSPGQ